MACATDADRYLMAARARSFDAAEEWCLQLDEPGECLAGAAVRFDRWEACERFVGRRRDDCVFMAAEARARQGAVEAALADCGAIRWDRQCNGHILGIVAHAVADVPAAAARFEELRPLLVSPSAELDFWRAFWRAQVERSAAIDPAGCPLRVCVDAARTELEATFHREHRGRPCEDPAPAIPGAEAGQARAWVVAAHQRWCAAGTP
jgi:hypothetical protein